MFTMTKPVLAVALMLGTASAALAVPHAKHARLANGSASMALAAVPSGFARQTRTVRSQGRNRANDVYFSGYFLGSDPDPLVRNMLLNDPDQSGVWIH